MNMKLCFSEFAHLLPNEISYSLLIQGFLLVAAGSWWFILRSMIKTSRNLPPGPFGLPVLGSLHLLGALPHVSLHNLSRKYGPVMHLKLGTSPYVIVSSAATAEELYKSHGLRFASKARLISGKYFGYDYSGAAFNEYTPQVKLIKKIMYTHLLSATSLKSHEKLRREEHLSLVCSIASDTDLDRPIKLRQKVHEMNMNIISCMLFGERFHGPQARKSEELDAFVEALVEMLRIIGIFNLGDIIPAISWMDLQGLEKQYSRLISKINPYLVSTLEERKKNIPSVLMSNHDHDHPVPFIDALLALDSTDDRVSDATKLALLTELLVAGVDTSAVAIEWALTELLRHPDKLERVRKEIDDLTAGSSRIVQESELSSLPFLEAVVKETLRLHPPAPLAMPKVVRGGSVNLGGYDIPEGTCAFVNFYSIGIDEEFWKDPLEFKPERFLDDHEDQSTSKSNIDAFGQNFNFLPFGSGRRVCPGAKVGFDTVLAATAILVQSFDWEISSESLDDMGETFGLVCHKTHSLVAVAKPRTPAFIS